MNFIAIVATSAVFGLIPAVIAHLKGQPFFSWWLYGTVVWPIALIHVIFVHTNPAELRRRELKRELKSGKRKICPSCKGVIRVDAQVCRYCDTDVESVIS